MNPVPAYVASHALLLADHPWWQFVVGIALASPICWWLGRRMYR